MIRLNFRKLSKCIRLGPQTLSRKERIYTLTSNNNHCHSKVSSIVRSATQTSLKNYKLITTTSPIAMYSVSQHQSKLHALTQSISSWFESPRFADTFRSYRPEIVASKRGSLPIHEDCYANLQARKLLQLLATAERTGTPVLTMGALDPVQQSQMAHHLPAVYVSGWAASSTFVPGTHQVGPDLADYPYHTVPTAVERLTKAQKLHDLKNWDAQAYEPGLNRDVDYLKPIVADGDNGHGGISTVMKLAKAFGEAGVAGVHIEDQHIGGKKCGHQAGKVLCSTSEILARLRATRMQWDIMGLETVLIARTDAESSKLINSDHDPRDHRFILGVEVDHNLSSSRIQPSSKSLAEEIIEAEERGAEGSEIDQIERRWLETHELLTFDEAVEKAFERHGLERSLFEDYLEKVNEQQMSLTDSLRLATSLIPKEKLNEKVINWNQYLPRTREGYYRFRGGMESAIRRALSFAKLSDLIWIETKKPDLEQAKTIAKRIRSIYPKKGLVYNLSPSFNWLEQGFSDEDLKQFVHELGKVGFLFQLISLAGLHSTAAITAELSERIKRDGMLGYVELIQRKEKQLGCDVLKHQKWSGSEYIDRILNVVSAGSSSTAATGEDSTENTF
ncbi:isocitrate lyase [Phakopsora pachyrhizi]|uniref:methylisocitrate lyase n=1 Tax=Phakopsora pachyrhizi TaxID=170000 RepID=A0AAV0B0I3_PHAPC|nr:isocitrate lyase [Phakopsora pachyrhizi]KAI8449662.1 isocitrate lyase [Phakopsora pachyrhizi]CAH7676500.1 isocitrate lyase [Phakopsora pachyrhizi]CAH7682659.1 isocitrate lyase [Phakopsora pachyrhizi]